MHDGGKLPCKKDGSRAGAVFGSLRREACALLFLVMGAACPRCSGSADQQHWHLAAGKHLGADRAHDQAAQRAMAMRAHDRSEEHTSELQSPCNIVCRLL